MLLPLATRHTPCAGLGTMVPTRGAEQAGALPTSPVPHGASGAPPGNGVATAGGCEAGTGPPRCSQPLIASRRPALPPHLHPIYLLEPAQPRGMAAVGTVAGAALPPAEGGTQGPAPHAAGGAAGSSDGQAPRSWLWHRQGTAALPWGTWLAGGSMPCAASASPEGTGARPGAGSQRAPAR